MHASEVQPGQWGKSLQSLSLLPYFQAGHVANIVRQVAVVLGITYLFPRMCVEEAEAGELWGVDPQVSEMIGLQAPVKGKRDQLDRGGPKCDARIIPSLAARIDAWKRLQPSDQLHRAVHPQRVPTPRPSFGNSGSCPAINEGSIHRFQKVSRTPYCEWT